MDRVVRCGTDGVVVPVLKQYQQGLYVSASVKRVSDGFGVVVFVLAGTSSDERLFDALHGS
jgi:hypothetical protein